MMARFFIERPVLANVIAVILLLLGAVAIFQLPVAQYPPITPVTVQVSTKFPGASAKTLVETVALPIEQQVNGVEGMLYMASTSSSDGSYNLIVTFDIGTDPDTAQVLVQNRVAAAMAQLPSAVQQQGVVTNKKSTSILQIVTLQSDKDQYDALFLSNYATISIRDELARLPGVGGVVVFGIGEYSMRIWLDPEKMQERSLVPSDVVQAIQGANVNVGAGQLGMPPAPSGQDFQMNVNVAGPLDQAEQFEAIIVKAESGSGGRITRVRDVASVELGARSYSQAFNLDGRPAGGLAIFLLPDANALDTAAAVDATMQRLAKSFPEGLEYRHSARYDQVRLPVDSRGLRHAVRGRTAGVAGHRAVPAELPCHPGAGDDGARDHRRRLRRDGVDGLHYQHAHPVRHRAGHRHRGRRRHRRGGGLDATDRARQDTQGGRDRGDDRAHRADPGHHPRAHGRVHPGGLHARRDRPDVSTVRTGDRRDRPDQRGQRAHAQAHPVCAMAQAGAAWNQSVHPVPGLQLALPAPGERLCARGRRAGAARGGRGAGGLAAGARGSLGTHAGAHRVHPDRGSGLHGDLGAASERRLTRAHGGGPVPGRGTRRPRSPAYCRQ